MALKNEIKALRARRKGKSTDAVPEESFTDALRTALTTPADPAPAPAPAEGFSPSALTDPEAAVPATKFSDAFRAARDAGEKTFEWEGDSYTTDLKEETSAAKPRGLLEAGNIDLGKRPIVRNADGSISTVRSMSINMDGKEYLIPTVAADGSRILSDEEAIQQFKATGQHLGVFDNPNDATAYAQNLHKQQEKMYAGKPAAAPASGQVTAGNVGSLLQNPKADPFGIDATPDVGQVVDAVKTPMDKAEEAMAKVRAPQIAPQRGGFQNANAQYRQAQAKAGRDAYLSRWERNQSEQAHLKQQQDDRSVVGNLVDFARDTALTTLGLESDQSNSTGGDLGRQLGRGIQVGIPQTAAGMSSAAGDAMQQAPAFGAMAIPKLVQLLTPQSVIDARNSADMWISKQLEQRTQNISNEFTVSGKQSASRSFFQKGTSWDDLKMGADGSDGITNVPGNIARLVSEDKFFGSAWRDPAKVAGSALESAPVSIASMLPVVRGAKMAHDMAYAKAIAAGAGEGAAKAAATKAATKTASIMGGLSEGATGGGQQWQQTYDQVLAMDPDKLAASPQYQAALAQLGDPDRARDYVARRAADTSAVVAGVADALFASLGDRYIGGAVSGKYGVAGSVGRGLLEETPTETLQSGAEQLGTNLGVKQYADPTQSLSADVGEQAAAGGLSGGLMGAAFGGASHRRAATEDAGAAAAEAARARALEEWNRAFHPGPRESSPSIVPHVGDTSQTRSDPTTDAALDGALNAKAVQDAFDQHQTELTQEATALQQDGVVPQQDQSADLSAQMPESTGFAADATVPSGQPPVAPAPQTMPAPAEAAPTTVTPTVAPQAPVQTEQPGVASETQQAVPEGEQNAQAQAHPDLQPIADIVQRLRASPHAEDRATALEFDGLAVTDPSALPDAPAAGRISRPEYDFLTQLGELSGQRFVLIDAPRLNAEQFVLPGASRTVYINTGRPQQIAAIATAGHETTHLALHTLRNSADAEDRAIAATVDRLMEENLQGDALAQFKRYANQPGLDDAAHREEAAADIGGNLHADPVFYDRLLAELHRAHGPTGVRKFVAAIKKALKKLADLVQGHTFKDDFTANIDDVREALAQALIRYYTQHGAAAAQAQEKANLAVGVKRSTRRIREGKETLKKYGIKPNQKPGTYTIREIASALEQRYLTKYGRVERGDHRPEVASRLSSWMVDEVMYALDHPNDSGVGWYSTKFQAALDTFGAEFPELRTEKSARDLLTAIIAITSDGQQVLPNFRQAISIYDSYRRGNGLVSSRGHNRSSYDGNLVKLTRLQDEYGLVDMHAYLLQEETVSKLNKLAKEMGLEFSTEYQAHIRLPLSAVILGPKLGAFYANLMGAHGYLTMDRWWSRTFNRYRGTLLPEPTAEGLARFRELIGQPDLSDAETADATIPYRDAYADRGFKNGSEIEKAANTIHKAAFEELNDVPWNATDRTFMLSVVNRAQAKLARRGHDISIADIQAILWYYEKRLYGDLGAKKSADISYDEAATRVVEEYRRDRPAGRAVQGNAKGAARKTAQGAAAAQGKVKRSAARVVFEIAPDPNNAALAGEWNQLPVETRREISASVAEHIVPQALHAFGVTGSLRTQVGSYLDDTNPSFALQLDTPGPVGDLTRFLGAVLSQDSMVAISEQEFAGSERVGSVTVVLPQGADVEATYRVLRDIQVDGKQPIAGQSTVDGRMAILNYSGIPTLELARLVDEKLGGEYDVEVHDVFAYFPEKKDYGYASERLEGATPTGRAPLQGDADRLRAEATRLVRTALDHAGRDGSGRPASGRAAPGEVQAPERAAPQEGLTALPGAPQVRGATGPDPRLVAVAEQYARDNGITLTRQSEYVAVDPARAARIAEAYDAMPHAPQDPAVREAYENLIRQTTAQYQALADAGYRFWFTDLNLPDNVEYLSTPWNAMRELRADQSMGVFPTDDGFGTSDFDPASNPLLADTGIEWPVGSPDSTTMKKVLANDLFRAVHDAFGHGLEGAGFRADGEENAWQAHVRLFTGSAVGAITSETRGQNSWLNYGPHGEANRTAKVEDTVFADQKTGLMPEWTWTEGRVGDMKRSAPRDLFQGDFATKRSTVSVDVVVSSKGDTVKEKRGNVDSAGRQIAQTKQALQNFWDWYGDGPVNDKGRPVRLYHSTNADIAEFEQGRETTNNYGILGDVTLTRSGIFATPDREFSQEYLRTGGGQNVMPIYMALQNPFDIRNGITGAMENELVDAGINRKWLFDYRDHDWELFDNDEDGTNHFVDTLKSLGYDGAIFREEDRSGVAHDTYAAFGPASIKSAIGNRGSFDGTNPDIRRSAARKNPAQLELDYDGLYDKLETRPGTRPEQLDLGRAALAAAEERIFGRYPVGARSKPTLLGSGISRDFRRQGGVTLVGQKLDAEDDLARAHDLATMAQVLRDPRFETLRFFYVAGGEIVGEAAYSSRLPGSAYTPRDITDRIKADMDRFVADNYWILHNHPSGSAQESQADLHLTQGIAAQVPGFQGHVVIDHNEFNHITLTPDGMAVGQVISAPELANIDLHANPEVLHPLLGEAISSPKALAGIAKRMQVKDGYITLVGTDSQQRVSLITEVQKNVLQVAKASRESELRLLARVKRATRETRSRFLFAVVPGELADYPALIHSRIFTDVVDSSGQATSGLMGSGSIPETRIEQRGGKGNVREAGIKRSTPRGELRAKADELKAMTEDQRDNVDIYDFGYRAYVLYEAEAKMPKKEGTMKAVTENNSFALWQEADAVANVNGEAWLATKQEDPDDENDEGLIVWRFDTPYDDGEGFQSNYADKADAIAEFKQHLAKGAEVKRSAPRLLDKDGSPLVVYHGGPESFGYGDNTTVRGFENGYRPFFTTPDRTLAEDYARGGKVAAMHLRANPIDLRSGERVRELLALYNSDPALLNNNPDAAWDEDEDGPFEGNEYLLANSPAVVNRIRELGYDSMMFEERPGVISYATFSPSQVELIPDIRRSAQRQIDTPEFKQWFGKSRVQTMMGDPAVVYHGTPGDFAVFDKELLGTTAAHHPTSALGFFFAQGAPLANQFAEGDGGNVMPVYLKVENPYRMTVTEAGGIIYEDQARALREDLQKQGYDGIRIAQGGIWVAFEPTQIKSAVGNDGGFDGTNPDIRRSAPRQVDTPEFKQWFGDSKAVDYKGNPRVVYRGEHGEPNGDAFQSRRASLSFAESPESASVYAQDPNDHKDVPVAPRVYPAYLRIEKPFINNESDPFIDVSEIAQKLGDAEARRIAIKFADHVENTGNWMEEINPDNEYAGVADYLDKNPDGLGDLYFDAYPLLDDAEEVAKLKAAGYDGAIHIGNGETAGELEFKVFSPDQVRPAIKRSGGRKTDAQLAADHAVMFGQGNAQVRSYTEQAMNEMQADFEAAKRGRVSWEETDAGAEALASRLHWSVEAMSEALAQGNVNIGTAANPQSVPAADLLGAAASVTRFAIADLLQNPDAPDFASRMADALNLMIATRANLSEVGRALNYARRLQQGPTLSTDQMVRATQAVIEDAQTALGTSGNMDDTQRALTAKYNEALIPLAEAREAAEGTAQEVAQAMADLGDVKSQLQQARDQRDAAQHELTVANAALREAEKKRQAAVDKTPAAIELTRAEGEARRAENEAEAARQRLRDITARMTEAGKRTERAQKRLAELRKNTPDAEEIKRAEQKLRMAQAEAKLAQESLARENGKLKDAEERTLRARAREAAAKAKMPSGLDITKAQGEARRAEAAAAQAQADLSAARKKLRGMRDRLKNAEKRNQLALQRLQGVQQQIAQMKKPQFTGKGGISMEEIEAFIGGKKGMERIARAMRATPDLDIDQVALFFQGVAETLYDMKKDATRYKGLWHVRHRFMSGALEQFRAFNVTGIFTQTVNTASNIAFGSVEVALTRALAEGMEGGPRAVGRHYTLSLKALLHTIADIKAIVRFGMTQEFPAAHFEALTKARRGTRQDLLNLGGNKWMDHKAGDIPGLYGKGVRSFGFSPLGTADLIFKVIPYRYMLALQEAKGQVPNPKKAVEFAQLMTFQQKLGDFIGGLPKAIAAVPELGFLIPYVKTLVGLIKAAAMLDPVMSTLLNYNDIRGYNDTKEDPGGARRLGIARVAASFMLFALTMFLYGEGDDDPDNLLQGPAPLDPNERELWLANHKPFGLKWGDGRISLERMEPFAGMWTLHIADKQAFEKLKEGEFLAALGKLGVAWTQLLVGKSFMQTPAEALRSAIDPEGYGKKFAARTAVNTTVATLIPNLLPQLGDIFDPWQRETENVGDHLWGDQIARRLPWERESLDPRLGYDGEAKPQPRYHTISPFPYYPDKPRDEVADWALRNEVPIERMPKGLKRDEDTLKRVPLADRQEILRARREGLGYVTDNGITAELRKMKRTVAEEKALKDVAKEAAGDVKGDIAEAVKGARYVHGVEPEE